MGARRGSRGGGGWRGWRALGLLWALAAIMVTARAQTLVVASTTSLEQSGFWAYLMPRVRQATGLELKVVALGTGQALDLARRGDADVVVAHDPEAEARFMAEGWGLRRHEVMVSDFVLVGPRDDPAGARGGDILGALRRVAAAGEARFVSRGDQSGTHWAEQRLWALAGVSPPAGARYRACGCGMGQALNIAAGLGAYTLSDRATWLSFRQQGALAVLVEGDARLRNPYSVIVVHPARHPHVRAVAGQRFVDWLRGPDGQAAIATFRLQGQSVFLPLAGQ